jgi:DNA-binding MarR family transcriptional regulator
MAAERVAQSMIDLWRQAHEDVAPALSDEQMRVLLALEGEQRDVAGIAGDLGVSSGALTTLLGELEARTLVRRVPSGEFRLTGAGTCVLEATRQRRRQLLERTLVTTGPWERPVLRDALDQLRGAVSPLARVPRSRRPPL